jgi:hypothetical protein
MITARILWRAVPAWLKWAILGALGAAALFGGGYTLGTSHERTRDALKASEAYQDTRERIDNAGNDLNTPDAVDDSLRDLANP